MRLKKVSREDLAEPASTDDLLTGGSVDDPVTVSALTQAIRSTLAEQFETVAVRGELSALTVAASGHRYLTLKDDDAVLSAVMWKGRRLDASVAEGSEVIAIGSIVVYPPRGTYQLDCRAIHPVGIGSQAEAFELLKKKLAAEGLFDPDRKRSLPKYPRRIGVVTSPTGAAIRDILDTLERRMPSVEVIVSPARVQGIGAAEEICAAMEKLLALPEETAPDVIIVGRGGGSAEDLAAFNDEELARRIAVSPVPTISAVGHEIDFSIADFVADVRAATPTAAAELAVRDRVDLVEEIEAVRSRAVRAVTARVEKIRSRLEAHEQLQRAHRPTQKLRERVQRLDELTSSLRRTILTRFERYAADVDRIEVALRALDPDRVLKRGYAAVSRAGSTVSSVGDLAIDDAITIRMHDGRATATVIETDVESE